MFTQVSESTCGLQYQLPVSFESEGLLKVTGSHVQAVTYTVNVLMSPKRCKIESLLL